jgi:hypothetical protein
VRGERPVLAGARVPVPAQLPADRRRTAACTLRDRPHPGPGPAQVRDPDPLILRQIPRRDLPPARSGHRSIMQLPAVPGSDRAAVSPPFPGPPADPDDPARLRITEPLRDQTRIMLSLLNLRRPTRPPATSHRNPRTHRVLRRPLEIAPFKKARAGQAVPQGRDNCHRTTGSGVGELASVRLHLNRDAGGSCRSGCRRCGAGAARSRRAEEDLHTFGA